MRPQGVAGPRVVVSLHGKDGEARATFSELELQRHIVETGLAVAAIDGGNYYWHARRSESTGDDDISPDTPPCDTGAMVMDDFIPLLGRLGLDVSRVGFLGWSMGGYGALLLATTMGLSAVGAVAPLSAALWPEARRRCGSWHTTSTCAEPARVCAHRTHLRVFLLRDTCPQRELVVRSSSVSGLTEAGEGGQRLSVGRVQRMRGLTRIDEGEVLSALLAVVALRHPPCLVGVLGLFLITHAHTVAYRRDQRGILHQCVPNRTPAL